MNAPVTLEIFQTQLRSVERDLTLQLEKARATLHHGGNKGTFAENAFRDALGRYLPRRLSLGHGEVIDSHGARSAQCDLVVATDQHPNWFVPNEPALFLVEGVAAAAEVKANLTSAELAKTIANTKRFRALRSNWGKRAEVLAAAEDIERFYRNPPYFLFAYESQLAIETIADRVEEAADVAGRRHGESLDAVFILDRGYVLNVGSGRSAFVLGNADGHRLTGYFHDDKDAMLTLMQWLPLVLASPLSQLPILSQYLLGDPPTRHGATAPNTV
jgi:hypothetical protein